MKKILFVLPVFFSILLSMPGKLRMTSMLAKAKRLETIKELISGTQNQLKVNQTYRA
jgi:hypothetical protein